MSRRRRQRHEDHANHEAWAIPYGDLVTLLLAFFVVMYAVSSVNEGKYRVLSDSLFAAFNGGPRSLEPVQIGQKERGAGTDVNVIAVQQVLDPAPIAVQPPRSDARSTQEEQLAALAREVETAMSELIADDLLTVRRTGNSVEVEIRTDILFSSGEAILSPAAGDILRQLANTLQTFPNAIRVEGHTDNRPINTRAYPSNWELSSARAASVVHLFTETGVDPTRLAVIGLGEYRPAQSNDTPEGRNANRRVLLVILGRETSPEGVYAADRPAIQGIASGTTNDNATPATARAMSVPATE